MAYKKVAPADFKSILQRVFNHFATKLDWYFKKTKNDVFLAKKRSRNFFDMGEGAIDSLDVCLSYEIQINI